MEIRILSKIGKDTYIQNLEFPLNIYITKIRRFLSATGPIYAVRGPSSKFTEDGLPFLKH